MVLSRRLHSSNEALIRKNIYKNLSYKQGGESQGHKLVIFLVYWTNRRSCN